MTAVADKVLPLIFMIIFCLSVGFWIGKELTEDYICALIDQENVNKDVTNGDITPYAKGWRDCINVLHNKIKGAVKHGRNA